MGMKWNPISDGDLSGIPRNEELLFTVFDEKDGETYVTVVYIIEYDGKMEVWEKTSYGLNPVEAKKLTAWMERPNPFKPGRCDICNHYYMWTDSFGDHWSECRLGDKIFSKGACPLEK